MQSYSPNLNLVADESCLDVFAVPASTVKSLHVLRALPPGTVPFPVKHLSGEGGEQRSGQGSLSGTGLRKPTPAHVAAQNS